VRQLRTAALTLTLIAAGLAFSQSEPTCSFDPERSNIPTDQVLRAQMPQGIPGLGHEGDCLAATQPSPAPAFVTLDEAAQWIDAREPVIAVEVRGEARAYPLQILTWHEIANDTLGGVPIAVTFCPLCNSAIAFDRRIPLTDEALATALANDPTVEVGALDDGFRADFAFQYGDAPTFVGGLEVTFGVSGFLYNSNLLMFDSQTFTLWSQILGEGNIGTLTGTRLLNYPAQIVAFESFRENFPDALVLSRETGFARDYGANPYPGYDDVDNPPFLFNGVTDGRLPPKARVVSVELRGDSAAYPFEILEQARVVDDRVGDEPLTVFWQEGTSSALAEGQIAGSRDVGAVGVFSRNLGDRELSFSWNGDAFVDDQTGSLWDLSGRAVTGELAGSALRPLVHDNTLWFAWAAFKPETRLYTGN
jgi:hypothetical protein